MLNQLPYDVECMDSYIRGLSSLGESEASYGDLLVPIIMNKLTTEVRCNLAREHSNNQWILSDLMAALRREIRVLESAPHNVVPKTSTTAAFQVGAKDNRDQSLTQRKKIGTVCVFCKGPHPAHACNCNGPPQANSDC